MTDSASGFETTDTALRLADFIFAIRADDVPESALDAAQKCVLDLFGTAAAGVFTRPARSVRRLCGQLFGSGSATVWFDSDTLPPLAAAYANSAAASALDLDDGHRAAAGHPGASIIPAAMAVAEEIGVSGKDLLTAIVLGYDISVRIAAGRDFDRLDTLSTGRWCGYGVVAACGWLQHLSSAQIAQALAVAGVHAPILSPAGYSRVMGNNVKEAIPWATFTGLTALALAQEGITGPTDLFDHPDYFDAKLICSRLGETFAIEQTYFKMYSCCRWIHSALDALGDLMAENDLQSTDVKQVDVFTFKRALTLNNYPHPRCLEAAQYSIPFCLGVLAVKGKDALLPMGNDILTNPNVIEFARKVRLHLDPELDALFPAHTAARIRIVTTAGVLDKTVVDPLGDPGRPISHRDLEAKFRHLTMELVDEDAQSRLIQTVFDLDQVSSIRALTDLLRISA